VLSFDLSGMGGPTGSYATADIALRVIAPHKPPYPAIMPSSRWRYLKEAEGPSVITFFYSYFSPFENHGPKLTNGAASIE